MAAKRTATTELNHDNWAEEEESEEMGTFKKASEDTLKGRVIKSARRRTTGAAPNEAAIKGIFSGFTAFGKRTTQDASSKPFEGVSFGALGNGKGLTTPQSEPKEGNTKSSNESTSEKRTSNSNKRTHDYNSQLKGLNESVAKWIKTHVEATPVCILTPIFRDYEKHLKAIEERHSKVDDKSVESDKVPEESSAVTKTTLASTFSFSSSASSPKTTFSFTSKPTETTETKPAEPAKTTSIFGNSSATFTFGQTTSTPPTGIPSTGFSFGKGTPFSFGNVAAPVVKEDKKPETEEENDEPPTVEFTPVIEEDSVYTIRCKVFIKKDSGYADGGVGNLFLKPVKDSKKTQLIVRADTSLGNLLVNILLSESIPTQKMGKNNVMLVCVYLPDKGPTPTSILLRVKTAEEADKLLEMINKYKN